MGKGVIIEYSMDVTKGGITSKVKMEASIPEVDLQGFIDKYGAKVINSLSKVSKASDSKEDSKKENKKSNK